MYFETLGTWSYMAFSHTWHLVTLDTWSLGTWSIWQSITLGTRLLGTYSTWHSVTWHSVTWHSVCLALSHLALGPNIHWIGLEKSLSSICRIQSLSCNLSTKLAPRFLLQTSPANVAWHKVSRDYSKCGKCFSKSGYSDGQKLIMFCVRIPNTISQPHLKSSCNLKQSRPNETMTVMIHIAKLSLCPNLT